MSTIYSIDDNVEINIRFPKEKVKKFLKRLNKSNWNDINLFDKEKIFLWSVEDFKIGELSLDEMSEISSNMWSSLPAGRSSDFADILYTCGELNYEIRYIRPDQVGMFGSDILKIFEYYEHNKYKLN